MPTHDHGTGRVAAGDAEQHRHERRPAPRSARRRPSSRRRAPRRSRPAPPSPATPAASAQSGQPGAGAEVARCSTTTRAAPRRPAPATSRPPPTAGRRREHSPAKKSAVPHSRLEREGEQGEHRRTVPGRDRRGGSLPVIPTPRHTPADGGAAERVPGDQSAEFTQALATCAAARLRPEVRLTEVPAPQRIAPYAVALTAEVVGAATTRTSSPPAASCCCTTPSAPEPVGRAPGAR